MKRETRTPSVLNLWMLAILVFCVLGYGCSDDAPLKLGFIGGTSGRVADLGISGRDAVQMMVEEYNRNDKLNGRRIELLIRDDKQDSDIARKAAQELIDEGVVAIIGPMTSDMAVAITPLLDKARVPAISPTASSQKLSGIDDYFFRVSSTTREFATKSAAYHIKAGDMRRIVAVFDRTNLSFTENWLDNFQEFFAAHGGEVIARIGFDSQQNKSFTDITNELLAHQPDGILIVANSMDSAMFCQQIRKADTAIPITLADWGATERLLELGGKAVEGVTVVQTFNRDDPGKRYQAFRKAFLDRFKREPGFPGVYASDATQLVLSALQKREKNQDIKDAILSVRQFQGLQSEFRFDEFGDVIRSHASISVIRDRTFIVID